MTPATLTRRAALTAAAGLAAGGGAPSSGARPNILWLVSEDNDPFIGAYGDKLAHTPNIDALAAKGVLFRNAYCNTPVCAPSRFTILTGIDAESCAPANHMRARAALPKVFRTYPELMRTAGYFCINNPKTDYNCDVDPQAIWDIQGRDGHWRRAPKDKPFLCVLNLGTTHESQACEALAGAVTPAQVRVPAFLPDTPAIREAYATYYNLIQKMDGEVGMRLAQLQADGLADNTIVFYYSDNGGVLPGSKRYCHDEGMRVALMVHVPPKWRHLLPAEPGSVIEAPVSHIDLAPTLLAIAGVPQPPQMTGSPLLGRRARRSGFAFGQRGRMDERYDFVRTVTDGRWRYIRNYMPHLPQGQHISTAAGSPAFRDWEAAWRGKTANPAQARFFEQRPFEELYDLAADPDEIDDRSGDPAAGAVLARLSRALDAHMLRINDNGFLPEAMAGEGYFESRDGKSYPLRRLITLGAAAGRRRSADLPLFLRELDSPVPVVRYWAVMGLLLLGPTAAPARPRLNEAMRRDASDHVRIAAAQALARMDQDAKAVQVLADYLAPDRLDVLQLHAINALTYVGPIASAAIAAIQAAGLRRSAGSSYAADESSRPYAEYVRRCAEHLLALLNGTYDPAAQSAQVTQICPRVKGSALKAIGSEGSFPN